MVVVRTKKTPCFGATPPPRLKCTKSPPPPQMYDPPWDFLAQVGGFFGTFFGFLYILGGFLVHFGTVWYNFGFLVQFGFFFNTKRGVLWDNSGGFTVQFRGFQVHIWAKAD